MTNYTGARFDRDRSIAEITKQIRSDVRAAMKAGELPLVPFSCRSGKYTAGASITVSIFGPSRPFDAAIADRVEAIARVYNRDCGTHARFYLHVE